MGFMEEEWDFSVKKDGEWAFLQGKKTLYFFISQMICMDTIIVLK